jgi:hypothetical protein
VKEDLDTAAERIPPPEEEEDTDLRARELEKALADRKDHEDITQRRRSRRLHFASGCCRVPGAHYKEFIDGGQEFPKNELIHARCTDCFHCKEFIEAADEIDEDQDISETSSSSSKEEVALCDGPGE